MLKKLIHIDDFFDDPSFLYGSVAGLKFVQKEFGLEIENFNLITPNIGQTFSTILGEPVTVDETRSGVFRKPDGFIHFEDFSHHMDWVLVTALYETTFNVFHHKSAEGPVDSIDMLHGYKFNYRNLFEWEHKTNIVLFPNQCLFFRPWLFHSFIGGCTHLYFLNAYNKET